MLFLPEISLSRFDGRPLILYTMNEQKKKSKGKRAQVEMLNKLINE